MQVAGIRPRLLAMLYEAVLLAALLLAATTVFVIVFGDSRAHPMRSALQAYLLLVTGAYFVGSWTEGRCTLPMRTWRLKLVRRDGGPVGIRSALIRFLAALLGISACGLGILWLLIDPDRQFLHDRIAGTRLVPV